MALPHKTTAKIYLSVRSGGAEGLQERQSWEWAAAPCGEGRGEEVEEVVVLVLSGSPGVSLRGEGKNNSCAYVVRASNYFSPVWKYVLCTTA
jgi:hypothetical protein